LFRRRSRQRRGKKRRQRSSNLCTPTQQQVPPAKHSSLNAISDGNGPLVEGSEASRCRGVGASICTMARATIPVMSSSSLQIGTATRGDLDLMVDWAAGEGWNPGLSDADCFYAADPKGFLIGRINSEPIGCISVVRYQPNFGFLGFYIVKPEERGRGHGFRIWQAGMAQLADCVVGLDGVIAQQDSYKTSGFVLAHRNIRFGGVADCDQPRDTRIAPISPDLVDAVVAYDGAFFPAERSAFLRCWLRPEQRKGLALVENGSIRGYGVIRACRSGHKIGPLFADTDEGADLLFCALAGGVKGQEIFLDCPEPNRAATDLAARYRLSPVFETARMYRGAAPKLPLPRIFGISSFELG
jgi:Acetyltransferase (GNAT) domain/Acetyltransferase (GNAT) family